MELNGEPKELET